jgi:SAM-dependent methyltransferase
MYDNEAKRAARFADGLIRDVTGLAPAPQVRVLDFGCGAGELVDELSVLGYDAYGCDIRRRWPGAPGASGSRLGTIRLEPYRLPFPDAFFDVVISTSVLEHAQNKVECFREIHRVLRGGGYAIHVFPAKWYVPVEPHLRVPLVNHFWPHCPRWWLALWALLGVRKRSQRGWAWRAVVAANAAYCADGLCYWPQSRYRRLSYETFGDYASPMDLYLRHSYGRFARLAQVPPLRAPAAWLSRTFRMAMVVNRKQGKRPLAAS